MIQSQYYCYGVGSRSLEVYTPPEGNREKLLHLLELSYEPSEKT